MKNKNIEQEKQLVVQSNPLVEAQYRLDLVEQKVLRYLVSMITPYDETLEKKFYRVQIKELEEFLGWVKDGGEIFSYIKRVADKLKSTTIKIKKPDTTIVTSWIASYEYPKNEGWIEFELSSKLESELLRLKEQFTQYYLKNISKLKSQYSIRLYELLKQHLNIGKKEESLESLRIMLGLQNEYKEFRDIKRRILDQAYKEINQKTDISFQWKPLKESRKVVGIVFYDIEQKTPLSNNILSLMPENYQGNGQVLKAIKKYIELCGEDYVIEKLNYTNSRHPKKWTDYLLRALEYNYGEGYIPNQDETPTLVEDPGRKTAETSEKRKTEEEQTQKAEDAYLAYKKQAAKAYLASLSPAEIEDLKEAFVGSLNGILKPLYEERGLDGVLLQTEYEQYIFENRVPVEIRLSFSEFGRKQGYFKREATFPPAAG